MSADAKYVSTWAALMVLLAATVAVSRVDLGLFNVALALLIAAVKTLLVMAYFMHLQDEERILWLAAGAGFVWLALLIVAMLDEMAARPWLGP